MTPAADPEQHVGTKCEKREQNMNAHRGINDMKVTHLKHGVALSINRSEQSKNQKNREKMISVDFFIFPFHIFFEAIANGSNAFTLNGLEHVRRKPADSSP